MEFPVIQTAEHQPGGCFLCGNHQGPFIDAQIEEIKILTPDGEQRIAHARVYFCIGNEDRPGCVAQMISEVGGVQPWTHAREAEQHRQALENVVEREQAATSLVHKLRSVLDTPPPSGL